MVNEPEVDLFLLMMLVALFVSSIHMVAPDHWLPLSVIASARSYSPSKKYVAAAALGFAHAGTSIAIAIAVFYAGIVLIHQYLGYLILVGQVLLVIVGIYFIINGYREGREEETSFTETSAISISAFPDFSLLPMVISAASLSTLQISGILAVFALSSGLSLMAMVFVAEKSLGKALAKIPPKYMDYVIGAVLILTAALVRFV